jgi:hypothetical protein
MDSLADLSTSLDHPAIDIVPVEDTRNSVIDDFPLVYQPARPFISIIRDRFPSLDADIARKLGEANWQRRERLRIMLASAPEAGDSSSISDKDDSSIADTIVGPRRGSYGDQETTISTGRSSISLTQTFQSVTISSQFSEPSIFDRMSVLIPTTRKSRPTESVTSFTSSVLEQGQRRVPNLPEDHDYSSSFQCKICGEILNSIRHQADWK